MLTKNKCELNFKQMCTQIKSQMKIVNAPKINQTENSWNKQK